MENKNYILTYDINSIPEGWIMNNLLECVNNTGIIFYDSKKGKIPKVTKLTKNVTLEIKDINS